MKLNDMVQPAAPAINSKLGEGDSFACIVTHVGDVYTSTNSSLDKPREETQFVLIATLTELSSSHKKAKELEIDEDVALYMRLEIDGNKSVHPFARAILTAAQEAGLDDTADLVGATVAVERGEDDEVPGRSFSYPTFTAVVKPPKARKASLASMVD